MEAHFRPSRREILRALLLVGPLGSAVAEARPESPAEALAALERRAGGRLGVAVFAGGTGKQFGHRSGERFALCSTFKLIAAAAVLQRVDQGEDRLDRFVRYTERDLLEYAPVTRAHVSEGGMRLGDLCVAAVGMSDNTAANLLLDALGGPDGLTRFCRSLGDRITRLDRTEPSLNVVLPGEVHDTTTPAAMLGLTRRILMTKTLRDSSRRQLETWLVESKVGGDRIPAGLPPHWRIGHKPGTGPAETNDVAVAWPGNAGPLLIACFYRNPEAAPEQRARVLAEVGRLAAGFAGAA